MGDNASMEDFSMSFSQVKCLPHFEFSSTTLRDLVEVTIFGRIKSKS